MTSTRRPLTTEERQAARHLHTVRGARHERGIAIRAWWCEGRWQCEEQMDIWQCTDEVVLDAMRERGEDESAE